MEIIIIAFLIFLNGLLAMSEMAILTSRKSRLKQLSNSGDKKAKEALEIAENPNNFLSTIQVGITLIAILSGVFAGEAIINPLSEAISGISMLDKYSDLIALGIVVSTITFLSLIFGELVPKRIALRHPEKIATFTAYPMNFLSTLTIPVVLFLTWSTDFVMKLLRQDSKNSKNSISKEEIKILLGEGLYEGTLEKDEVEMIYSVFKLSDITVDKVMIPQNKLIEVDKNTSLTEVIKLTRKYHHSRYPVYEINRDNIIGFFHIKDIYLKMINEEKNQTFKNIFNIFLRLRREQKLKDLKIIRPIYSVKENVKIDDAMLFLKNKAAHVAVVKNLNGKTIGIVALEDIFEKVVGEIKDEFDELNTTPQINRSN